MKAGHHASTVPVERCGIEPVPAGLKTVGFWDQFSIFINFLINPSVMLHGGAAVAMGLSFQAACLAVGVGTLSALVPYTVMTRIGVDYGIPGQVAARISFGIRGAQLIPSAARVICSIYFFALNTLIGTIALHTLFVQATGRDLPLSLIGMLFGVLQILFAVLGYDWLKTMSRFVLPLKLCAILYLAGLLATHPGPEFRPLAVWHYQGSQSWSWGIIAVWFNTSCSSWLSMITDAADFCRYSRSRRATYWGVGLASVCGTLVAAVFGAYAAACVLGTSGNVFTILSSTYPQAGVLVVIFVLLLLDNVSINSLNIYTGGLALENMLPALNRATATMAVSVVGILLSGSQDVVSHLIQYLAVIGSMFAPISGIIIADIVYLHRWRINTSQLFDPAGPYWYWHGFNRSALACMAGGMVLYYLVIPPSLLKPLLTFVVTGGAYMLLSGFERAGTVARH